MKNTMKKILCTVLVIIMCLTSAPLSGFVDLELPEWLSFNFKASASYVYEYKGNLFTCVENQENNEYIGIYGYKYISISSVEIYNAELEFPSEVNGVPVTDISSTTYENGSIVTSLIIPGTIICIPDDMFSYSKTLEKVTLQEGVQIIGFRTFSYCDNLKRVDLPQSLDVVLGEAFACCESLEKIIVRNGQTHFEKGLGTRFPSSTATIYGYENSTAQEMAELYGTKFKLLNCEHSTLDLVQENPTCSEDGYESGEICYKCGTWIRGGKTLEAYGHDLIITAPTVSGSEYKYSYSEELTCNTCGYVEREILNPNYNYDEEEVRAFFNEGYADPETQVVIIFDLNGGTLKLPAYVFSTENRNFTLVENIQKGYLSIPKDSSDQVVGQSIQLPKITPPSSELVFAGWYCYYTGEIYTDTFEIPEGSMGEDIEFYAIWNTQPPYLGDIGYSIQIPGGVRYTSGFGNTSYLYDDGTLIVKGNGVISDQMFVRNTKIKKVRFMDGITGIGHYAFFGCYNLKEIILPDSLTSIGFCAFNACGLESIEIPSSVTTIGDWAFRSCIAAKDIYLNNKDIFLEGKPFGYTDLLLREGVTTEQFFAWLNEDYTDTDGKYYTNGDILYLEDERYFDDVATEYATKYVYVLDEVEKIEDVLIHCYRESTAKEYAVTNNIDYVCFDHLYEISSTTAPSCTAQGFTTYTCECGDSYKSDYTDMLEHQYTSEITTTATHLIEGVKTFTCECGDSYTEPIDKLTAHTYEKSVTAPTCTDKGYTTYVCACGDEYIDDYVDIIDHSFTEWNSEDNKSTRYCTVCNFTETKINTEDGDVEIEYDNSVLDSEVELIVSEEEINANYAFGDEFENYKAYDISLTVDGEAVQPNGYVTVKLPLPEGFNAETTEVYYVAPDGTKTKLDSTVENGYVVFETNHFSEYVLVDESSKIEPPHVHSYTASITKTATCTEPGTKTYTCTCGDTYTETISATGHDFDGSACKNCDFDKASDCSCNCHKGGIMGFFWKIINFFNKLFKSKEYCSCGAKHW